MRVCVFTCVYVHASLPVFVCVWAGTCVHAMCVCTRYKVIYFNLFVDIRLRVLLHVIVFLFCFSYS